MKSIQITKEKVKLYLFADDMNACVENAKNFTLEQWNPAKSQNTKSMYRISYISPH